MPTKKGRFVAEPILSLGIEHHSWKFQNYYKSRVNVALPICPAQVSPENWVIPTCFIPHSQHT